jgi:hypothetical protein
MFKVRDVSRNTLHKSKPIIHVFDVIFLILGVASAFIAFISIMLGWTQVFFINIFFMILVIFFHVICNLVIDTW